MSDEPNQKKAPTAAQLLVELAAGANLFHSPDMKGFMALDEGDGQNVFPIRSKDMRLWLQRKFFVIYERAANAQALQDALGVLEGKARYDGASYPVYVRMASQNGCAFLDLAGSQRRVVEIAPQGWGVNPMAPVFFRRPRGLQPLPTPARGGKIADLRHFVNVGSDEDFALLVGWLIGAFNPFGSFPILVLHGEHGSAKSSTARMVRSLIDPNEAPLRAEPREARDLAIAASNAHTVCFDNISAIPVWLSDALCRLSTGGGFATRELYSDDEEAIFSGKRPVLLNGIEEIATRSDLLDRCIMLELPPIPDDKRQSEAELNRKFEAARPGILGALLDAVSCALANFAQTNLPALPRMADFARWVVAAEPALGLERGLFMRAYMGNRSRANVTALEAAIISQPLIALLDGSDDWNGTAMELLSALDGQTDDGVKKAKGWPRSPRAMSGALKRIAPNLRAEGIAVEFRRDSSSTRRRRITIRKLGAATVQTVQTAEVSDATDCMDEPTRLDSNEGNLHQ